MTNTTDLRLHALTQQLARQLAEAAFPTAQRVALVMTCQGIGQQAVQRAAAGVAQTGTRALPTYGIAKER